MLVLADPRGTMVQDATLDDAIEVAQSMARDRTLKSPALAILQAQQGAFLITPAYHGSDAPFDLDPRAVKLLRLDEPGTTSPTVTSIVGNEDAPYFRALVTGKQVVTPEFE